jgi:hypothetical protein
MNTASVATLKLILDRLGVPCSIRTLGERKRVQKVIELVQGAGVDLGYSFGWYIRGPYSPGLTRDYFALEQAVAGDDPTLSDAYQLRESVARKLDALKPVLDPPGGVDLDQPEWLELLASLHYLQRVRKYSEAQADELVSRTKAHVAHHLADGRSALTGAGLL